MIRLIEAHPRQKLLQNYSDLFQALIIFDVIFDKLATGQPKMVLAL